VIYVRSGCESVEVYVRSVSVVMISYNLLCGSTQQIVIVRSSMLKVCYSSMLKVCYSSTLKVCCLKGDRHVSDRDTCMSRDAHWWHSIKAVPCGRHINYNLGKT